MKISIVLIVLVIMSCQNPRKEVNIVEYGRWEDDDRLGVEIDMSKFNTWDDLIDSLQIMACEGSSPQIKIKTDNEIKIINFRSTCDEFSGCYRARNVFEIQNDTILKYGFNFIPIDSLESFLKKDLENNGKISTLSERSENVFFRILYDNNELENIPKILSKICTVYEQTTHSRSIMIIMDRRTEIPPPPPSIE